MALHKWNWHFYFSCSLLVSSPSPMFPFPLFSISPLLLLHSLKLSVHHRIFARDRGERSEILIFSPDFVFGSHHERNNFFCSLSEKNTFFFRSRRAKCKHRLFARVKSFFCENSKVVRLTFRFTFINLIISNYHKLYFINY